MNNQGKFNAILNLVFFFCLSIVRLSAQDIVSIQNPEDFGIGTLNRVVPVVNNETGELITFFFDNSAMHVEVFDGGFNAKKILECDDTPTKYSILHGITNHGSIYTLYFSDESYDKYFVRNIDIEKGTKNDTTIKIDFKASEYFLESMIHQENLYVLTIGHNSSKLQVYRINANNTISSNKIDFTKTSFRKSDKANLFSVLNAQSAEYLFDRRITRIYNDNIATISSCSRSNKLYSLDKYLVLTIDSEPDNTKAIFIDPADLSLTLKFYNSPGTIKNSVTNSFIAHESLYQINSAGTGLTWSVTDLNDDSGNAEVFKVDESVGLEHPKHPAISVRGNNSENVICIGSCNNPMLSTMPFYRKLKVFSNNQYETLPDFSFTYGYHPILKEYFTEYDTIEQVYAIDNKPIEGVIPSIDVYNDLREYLDKQDFDKKSLILFRKEDSYYAGFFCNRMHKYLMVKVIEVK